MFKSVKALEKNTPVTKSTQGWHQDSVFWEKSKLCKILMPVFITCLLLGANQARCSCGLVK